VARKAPTVEVQSKDMTFVLRKSSTVEVYVERRVAELAVPCWSAYKVKSILCHAAVYRAESLAKGTWCCIRPSVLVLEAERAEWSPMSKR
jgi:hypothetical protein